MDQEFTKNKRNDKGQGLTRQTGHPGQTRPRQQFCPGRVCPMCHVNPVCPCPLEVYFQMI